MDRTLEVTPNKCIGCRTCELSCSFAKGEGNKLGPSRIKVFTAGKEKFVPYICLHCVDAACAKVCPTDAIYADYKTEAVRIDEEKCIGCGACQSACPFGNIFISRKEKSVFKCDLCDGDPKCAAFCPTGSLKYC